jgi:hypothetical protein
MKCLWGTVVSGSTGCPVVGAQVIAEEICGGRMYEGQTDEQGLFRFDALPRDRLYEVQIKKKRKTPRFIVAYLSKDTDIGRVALSPA